MNDLQKAFQVARATLQQRRGSLLTYCGIAMAFQLITAVALPWVGGMETVRSMLKSYSPAIQQLLKVTPAVQTGYSLQDHFAFTWLHPFFIGLCAAFVVSRSADALAGEIESGGVYLLLSRPISRRALVLGRVGELGLGLAMILLMSWLGLALGVKLAGLAALPADRYAVLVVTAWCLFMAVNAVALIASSLASRASVAAAVGTIWALGSYVLDALPPVANSGLAWLNPWHHYYPPAVIGASTTDWPGLIVLTGWIAGATLTAMWMYERRDLI